MARWIQTLLVGGLLIVSGLAAASESLTLPAIAPGQEKVLLAMLGSGAALPDECKLANASVDYTVVKADYTCAANHFSLLLVHPTAAEITVAQTPTFAIMVDSGSPPESMTDVLIALIRAREADFEWSWTAPEGDDADDSDVD